MSLHSTEKENNKWQSQIYYHSGQKTSIAYQAISTSVHNNQ